MSATEAAAQKLIEVYRKELVRVYGQERADASYLSYSRGWFYVNLAYRYGDGSVGTGGHMTQSYRRTKMLEMIGNLKQSKPLPAR